jgi:2-polyprenyl-3-methyl-5-hydroxy-6-metoxy-1,4-benzoquinol methylase
MSDKAAEIVRRALSDRREYDAMARKEREVWSSVLVSREQSEARVADQEAASSLRLNRDLTSLATWARSAGRTFRHGLSIGCGEGRAERGIIQQGICDSFVGIDVAESALEQARKKAEDANLPITYETADINFAELPKQRFDLIVAQTSLHHVLNLEHAAEQIARSLTPDGTLWIHDYIGESQFQYSYLRLEIANRVIDVLPARLRYDRLHGRQLGPVRRREPGTLISPFESIRSAEIPEIFLSRFDTLMRREAQTIIHLVVPVGTRANYCENEETRTLFELIFEMDKTLAATGVLSPVTGQYAFALKH